MAMTVTASGVSEVRARLAAFNAAVTLVKFADEASTLITGSLVAHAPKKTGQLQASIRSRRATSGRSVSVEFVSTAKQAKFVIHGTRAHGPAHAPLMVWEGPDGLIHAKWVRGVTPNPFNEKAWAEVGPAVKAAFRSSVAGGLGV